MVLRRALLPFMAVLGASSPALATDCDTSLSPCFDSNNLDLPAGPAHFVSIQDATALSPGKLSLALAGSYLRNPVVLTAPSPAPSGRDVHVVEDVYQLDLLFAVGLLPRLELGLAFPMRPYQDGTGIDGATSRIGGELRTTAVVDPRIGLGYQFLDGPVASKLRLETKLPLGDEDAFGGGPGVEIIPALLASSTPVEALHVAAEIGARFREDVQLGDVVLGDQLRFALGARYDVLEQLSLGAEAWIVPSLSSQPETKDGQGTFLPAEWLGSVGSAVAPSVWLMAAAGTGIPLSKAPGDDAESDDAVTTPTWRAFLSVRVTELGDERAPTPSSAK